jgi:hypothetical protein
LNVDWIIPCRYVEVHDNLATLVGAGIDTFWVQQFPASIQVLVAIRLTGVAEELDENIAHTSRNIITNPSGEVIGDGRVELRLGMPEAKTDWLNGVILPSQMVFTATEEGTYTVENQVDDSSKSIPLHVVQGLPPGTPPPPQ